MAPQQLPDHWLVEGTNQHGEYYRWEIEDEDLARHIAGKINNRGGKMTVARLSYNGPAAAWVPAR